MLSFAAYAAETAWLVPTDCVITAPAPYHFTDPWQCVCLNLFDEEHREDDDFFATWTVDETWASEYQSSGDETSANDEQSNLQSLAAQINYQRLRSISAGVRTISRSPWLEAVLLAALCEEGAALTMGEDGRVSGMQVTDIYRLFEAAAAITVKDRPTSQHQSRRKALNRWFGVLGTRRHLASYIWPIRHTVRQQVNRIVTRLQKRASHVK